MSGYRSGMLWGGLTGALGVVALSLVVPQPEGEGPRSVPVTGVPELGVRLEGGGEPPQAAERVVVPEEVWVPPVAPQIATAPEEQPPQEMPEPPEAVERAEADLPEDMVVVILPDAEEPPVVEVPVDAPVETVAEALPEETAVEAPAVEAVADVPPASEEVAEAVETLETPEVTPWVPSLTDSPLDQAVARPKALEAYARPFSNPDNKPPFAILLLDDPTSEVDLTKLGATDLALTLIMDPHDAKSLERATLWQSLGQEVALLTTALPRSEQPDEQAMALEILQQSFPAALALVEPATPRVQDQQGVVEALSPALIDRGIGLVTWEQGDSMADQVARREGVASGRIYRDLDAKGEGAPAIRRYLDRAAFKAQQEGRTLVMGRLRPETVAALMEWAVQGRANALALAPLSATLARP